MKSFNEWLKSKNENLDFSNEEKSPKTILSFPNGYSWVDLRCPNCEEEAAAMSHSGNVQSKPGDTLLSLRDTKNRPHLTFILNNGVLREMKGRFAQKPSVKYHNYIVSLLKLPIIKKVGIDTGMYSRNDFSLSDLSDEQARELQSVKPELFG